MQGLKTSGSVLVFSQLSLAEYSGPDDPRHADAVAEFLEFALPNLYFAFFDVSRAMDREATRMNRSSRLAPPPDLDLLALVAQVRLDGFRAFSIASLICEIDMQKHRLRPTVQRTKIRLQRHVELLRRNARVRKQAKHFKNHPVSSPTRAVIQKLLRPFFLDREAPFTLNDAVDLQHATISLAYCDFVLLDRKWESFAAQMLLRFKKVGYAFRKPRVFSGKSDGVHRFLNEFESRISDRSTRHRVADYCDNKQNLV